MIPENEFFDSIPIPATHQRTCSICLEAVERESYISHMATHGYEVLDCIFIDPQTGVATHVRDEI